MLRSQAGQSLIEATVGLLVLVLFVSAIVTGFYALWVKQRLSDLAYEGLVCQETREEKFCDLQFRRQVKTQIPFGMARIRQRTKSSRESSWVIDYVQKPISFSFTQSLSLPLK